MAKCRMLVCDLDNTLLKGSASSSWQPIWDFLGADKATRTHGIVQYKSGAFTYDDWCAHDARTFRAYGLREEHFPEICSGMRPSPNLRETLAALQQGQVRMAIVSGALDMIVNTALPWHAEFFQHLHVNGTRFDSSGLIESIIPTPYDFEGKLRCVQMLCRNYGIGMDETVFVGDGPNDLSLAGQVGLTVAFGSDCAAIKQAFDLSLPDDDFGRILQHIDL